MDGREWTDAEFAERYRQNEERIFEACRDAIEFLEGTGAVISSGVFWERGSGKGLVRTILEAKAERERRVAVERMREKGMLGRGRKEVSNG